MSIRATYLLVVTFLLAPFSAGYALVEWNVFETFKLEQTPLDVAFSTNGRWIFVLNDQGEILIYSTIGNPMDRIAVGKNVDGIKAGPNENILLLVSQREKTVQVLILDFTYEIDISDCPLKGPVEAPVTIAVFSDYQ